MKIVAQIFCLLAFSACTITLFGPSDSLPQPDFNTLPDIGLFSETGCIEACWQGLKPGITTASEAISILQRPPFANFSTGSRYSGGYTRYHAQQDDGYNVSIVVKGDHLFSIDIGAQFLKLNLDEIVHVLGIPNYSRIDIRLGAEVAVLEVYLDLYYPESGYLFHLGESDGIRIQQVSENEVQICIGQRAIVQRIEISKPGTIHQFLSNLHVDRLSDGAIELQVDQLVSWPGFGCINMPHPIS